MSKPKKDPMGDEYIPGEDDPAVDEPKKKRLPKEEPDESDDQKLPPDPER